jgi:hypothetical protein
VTTASISTAIELKRIRALHRRSSENTIVKKEGKTVWKNEGSDEQRREGDKTLDLDRPNVFSISALLFNYALLFPSNILFFSVISRALHLVIISPTPYVPLSTMVSRTVQYMYSTCT